MEFLDLVFHCFTQNVVLRLQAKAHEFRINSVHFLRRCSKPNWDEYKKIAVATLIGVGVMGFIGFFVKLIAIPLNNIIMS